MQKPFSFNFNKYLFKCCITSFIDIPQLLISLPCSSSNKKKYKDDVDVDASAQRWRCADVGEALTLVKIK